MSFLFNDNTPTANNSVQPFPTNYRSKARGTFGENLRAGFGMFTTNETTWSPAIVLEEIWDPIIDLIRERGSEEFDTSLRSQMTNNPWFPQNAGTFGVSAIQNPATQLRIGVLNDLDQRLRNGNSAYVRHASMYLKHINDNPDKYPELQGLTLEKILEQGREYATKKRTDFDELAQRSPGATKAIARFIGQAGGVINEPVVVGSMMLGGGLNSGLFKIALTEAVIGAGSEAILQPKVAQWYKELGLEMSWGDYFTRVAAGGLFGFTTPYAIAGTVKGISISTNKIRQGINVLTDATRVRAEANPNDAKLNTTATEVEQNNQAINEVADDIETTQTKPIENTEEHNFRLNEAERALNANEMPNIPEQPISDVNQAKTVYDNDPRYVDIIDVDFDRVDVDARSFQYKEGGDAFGVLPTLQGVTKWDPMKADLITIYERADGKQFVADGHQRFGLAKRIKQTDPSQDVRLKAYVLKETDGITVDQARIIAALKNIAQGSGSAIDAAKVLRVDPNQAGELPPNSSLVRTAKNLVNLSDDNFLMVVNNVIPTNFGAKVGELIPDNPELQIAAINVLSKTQPSNIAQATSIINQVKSLPTDQVKQTSLFGEEVISESFYLERAKVLDQTVKQLRQDQKSFENLIKNADSFKEEGNVLAQKANETRVDNDQKATQFLEKLANRRGEISEKLNEAAKRARADGNTKNATADFLQFIRGRIERGELSLIEELNAGSHYQNKTKRYTSENEEVQQGIDEPGGVEAQRQADSLKNDLDPPREAFQEDLNERLDLESKMNAGDFTVEQIEQHPAVKKAVNQMYDIPETIEPGKKSLADLTEEYLENRQFVVKDKAGLTRNVKGYTTGVAALYNYLTKFAWLDDGIDPPVNSVAQEKKAVILLGQPASGKSSIANPIARKMKAIIADSDEAKKILPEYQGGIGANAVHSESSMINDLILFNAVRNGDNIVIPQTGGRLETIEKNIKLLVDAGYDVTLGNVDVTFDNAMNRMIRRFISTGRLIPLEVMKEIGNLPKNNYNQIKGKVNGYFEIDNNQPKGERQTLLEDSREFLKPIPIDYKLGGQGAVRQEPGGVTTRAETGRPDQPGDQTPGQVDKDLFDQAADSQPGERQTDLELIIEEATTATGKVDLDDPFAQGPLSIDQLKNVVMEQYPGRFDVDTGPNGGLIVTENTSLNRVGEKLKDEYDLALDDLKGYKEPIKVEDPIEELDVEIPDVKIDDATGNEILTTTTPRQIKAEIDQDQRMLDRLEGCV
tara:strand:+ start:11161 stop:14934 length:3774 start_codon:yes stop_codon:yes gene_type:complete